ncbi:MAG: hypothetical protein H6Q51_155 [Deltaproteobacteria bacterium]|jgi:hypothetical protein|nr:hypothetical protein [Deltaproteobacteria bacterium]
MLMDRKIFTLNLSVEATSAYILVCSFVEGGAPATVESLGPFWNGPRQELPSALTELRSRGIIEEILDERLVRRYLPNPAEFWRSAGG